MGACSHKVINRGIYRANARPRCSVAKSRLALRYKYIEYRKVHVSKRKIPRNRKASGVFLLAKNHTSGAKTVPKRNSCECLLFTGVIFLPAFDLFDLFSTFRITMILQFQTDCFHNFLSDFIIKLIKRCK